MKFEKVDYEKRLRDYLNSDIDQTYKNMLLNLFPELAESEDERIRKEILEYFQQFENEELRGVNISDWIAWLEKQGEQKSVEEKIWSIYDAKDGDVLNSVRFQATIIFKGFADDDKHILAYCGLQKGIFISQEILWNRDFEPASEYWKNALYDAMTARGYEWDADRLELKKIEQKPAWSEDDQSNFNELSSFILETYRTEDASRLITWLEYLKDRVQPKQEWSEEDDRHRIHTISLVEDLREWANKDGMHSLCLERCAESIDWLKSLRPQSQWKPNDEQMKAMQKTLVDLCGKDEHNIITGLYYDLKKLREE